MSQCALLSVPEDVLCSLAIPDCRVLMMARTCPSMFKALSMRHSPVHVTVRQKALTDSRLAKEFTSGMYRMQALFHITHFECIRVVSATPAAELNLCEFEDLTFLHLRHLRMHNNQLREMHLVNLLYILKFSRGLRTFEFTQQSLKARHLPALASAISCFPALEVFNIENNFFVFDGLGLVLDAVQSSTLSTLKLSTNSCEDSTKTLQLCRVIYSSCTCLKVLELSFMRLMRTTPFEALAGAISTCELLESLDLSRNHLHCGCLVAVLESTTRCRRLHTFDWSGNRLGSAGTFLLANHIANNDSCKSSLRALKLASCDVYNNMQQLSNALLLCTSLQSLDISGNAVLAHEVAALLQHVRMRSLNISHNCISDFGIRALLRLATQSNRLQELHVDGNHITRYSVRLLRQMKKTRGMDIDVPRATCLCDVCDRA